MSGTSSYTSRVGAHWILRLVLILCFGVAGFTLVTEFLDGATGPAYYLVLLPLTIGMAFLVFTYQEVRLERDALTVRWFPLYSKRHDPEAITSVEVIESVSPWTHGGWGLRRHSRGLALLNTRGPGLTIHTAESRYTLITLPDAAEVARAVRESPYRFGGN